MPILNMMSWDEVVKVYHERLKDEDWYKKTQSAKEETLRWLQKEVAIDYKDAPNELPKGIVEDLYSCPIANYVHQYYTSEDTHIDKWDRVIPNHMVEVAVQKESLRCYQWDSQTQEEMFNAPSIFIPLDARNFITWFDIGEYPELMDVCDDVKHYAKIQEFLDDKDGYYSNEDAVYEWGHTPKEVSWGEVHWSPRGNTDELNDHITEGIGCNKLHIAQHDREAIASGERDIVSKMAQKELEENA